MGIVVFLIIILIDHLTYFGVWLNIFLVSFIGNNGINSGSRNRVVLKSSASMALILAIVMSILLVFFVGFASGHISGKLKSGPSYFFVGLRPRVFSSKIFFWPDFGLNAMYWLFALTIVLVDIATGKGQYFGFCLCFIGLLNQDIPNIQLSIVFIDS